jgi:hypothetical protein
MGGRQSMNAIVDTATDLVAVQGDECNNCTGNTYDLREQVENGRATVDDEISTVTYGDY